MQPALNLITKSILICSFYLELPGHVTPSKDQLATKHNNISHYIYYGLYMLNYTPISLMKTHFLNAKLNYYFNPYPTAFPYGNGMVLHFYQQQESSTTKTVHKVINKRLKAYV